MKPESLPPLLLADSEHNADQLWFGRFSVPDPYLAFGVGRMKFAALNTLEFSRGRRESRYDVILPLEDLMTEAAKVFRVERAGMAEVIALLGRRHRVKAFRVPADFPLFIADRVRALGLKLVPVPSPFFPERELKDDAEADAIRAGNACSAAGIAAAAAVLRAARIRGDRLVWKGREVTSELLKQEIEIACLRAGGTSINTIVASGDQACDPHCRGTGPVRANDLVIVDVFPRMTATGYYGDMTRTFLRGRASDRQRALVAAVADAQKAALAKVRAGVTGKAVHGEVLRAFARHGFKTTRGPEGPQGFIHGTGHGLGLAIHETPRVNALGPKLKAGQVVTIEPGLYYNGLGACRIEDVVRVTKTGSEMLSACDYAWEFAG